MVCPFPWDKTARWDSMLEGDTSSTLTHATSDERVHERCVFVNQSFLLLGRRADLEEDGDGSSTARAIGSTSVRERSGLSIQTREGAGSGRGERDQLCVLLERRGATHRTS